jgi:hypothetical protein
MPELAGLSESCFLVHWRLRRPGGAQDGRALFRPPSYGPGHACPPAATPATGAGLAPARSWEQPREFNFRIDPKISRPRPRVRSRPCPTCTPPARSRARWRDALAGRAVARPSLSG